MGKLLFWCGEARSSYGSEAPLFPPQWALRAFMDFRSRGPVRGLRLSAAHRPGQSKIPRREPAPPARMDLATAGSGRQRSPRGSSSGGSPGSDRGRASGLIAAVTYRGVGRHVVARPGPPWCCRLPPTPVGQHCRRPGPRCARAPAYLAGPAPGLPGIRCRRAPCRHIFAGQRVRNRQQVLAEG